MRIRRKEWAGYIGVLELVEWFEDVGGASGNSATADRARVLGADHPNVLTTRNNLDAVRAKNND